MRLRTGMLSAFTLSTAMSFGIAAMAGDLPKEGSDTGTYSGFGTYKAIPVGKERLLIVWDENGLNLSDGYQDHTAVHCWGTGDYTNGVGQDQGYCVLTDPAGDQIVDIVRTEQHPLDQKTYHVTDTWSGGTGKYAGISGGGTMLCHSGEFKANEGTYLQHCTWSKEPYKLP